MSNDETNNVIFYAWNPIVTYPTLKVYWMGARLLGWYGHSQRSHTCLRSFYWFILFYSFLYNQCKHSPHWSSILPQTPQNHSQALFTFSSLSLSFIHSRSCISISSTIKIEVWSSFFTNSSTKAISFCISVMGASASNTCFLVSAKSQFIQRGSLRLIV